MTEDAKLEARIENLERMVLILLEEVARGNRCPAYFQYTVKAGILANGTLGSKIYESETFKTNA